jgi:peptidyl-prolyl cis-trans isomerase C
MKSIAIFILLGSLPVWAQGPADISPETVVAHIGDKPVTAAQLRAIMQTNPPEAQKGLLKDGKTFVDYVAFTQKLAQLAEKEHLDQKSPIKETLEAQRMQTMAAAEFQAAQDAITVSGNEQRKFYQANKDRYTQAKIKLLYISFHNNPPAPSDPQAKKILGEPEAKAKTEKLLAQIRGGADFVKLLKEYSEDPSKAKDGDFGTPIRRSEKVLPDDVITAIYAMKPGQVSEPVRTPIGYYLFRLEELTIQPYEEVASDIFMEIRQSRFNEWINSIRKGLDVKIDKPEFFTQTTSSAAQPQK